ncbi:MAG: multiheme c-type cytochrome [Chloroflexota bacterium]
MRRLSHLLLAGGIAMLFLGVTLSALRQSVAHAALPQGHPPLQQPAGDGGARIASTLQDFFQPGTQPETLTDTIVGPQNCRSCHAGYNEQLGQPPETETWTAWQGSMMAQAARDPVFWAALDIANVDAEFAGELCLRCHTPRGWLEGRSTPADGSALEAVDMEGVQCEVCHRMVDPDYNEENPPRDLEVLAAISPTLTYVGNGAIIVDPEDERRGPFDLQEEWEDNPHLGLEWPLVSPYHQDSALCGSCHNVSNPLLSWNESSEQYELNDLDQPAPDPEALFPIERTYSEWLLSDYNSEDGVSAPQFGGNKTRVSTCQDCHMRDVTGAAGASWGNVVTRTNMPLHDLTGANTWVPQTIPLHPEFGNVFTGSVAAEQRAQALEAGIQRARYMLQNAATMDVSREDDQLQVTVYNETGHKLPTGYPEGRRMWLQVEGYDAFGELIYTSGAYDVETGTLQGYGSDPTLKVYEAKQGVTEEWAAQLGLEAGPTFHFILNNVTVKDNRIPPRGYEYDAFLAAGAAPHSNAQPDPSRYADGQYWDTTTYTLPAGVKYGVVRLLYQTSSREYIEFLRDNNPDVENPQNSGQILYDLWQQTDRSAPEVMAEVYFDLDVFLPLLKR